jgi:hypothetical protein
LKVAALEWLDDGYVVAIGDRCGLSVLARQKSLDYASGFRNDWQVLTHIQIGLNGHRYRDQHGRGVERNALPLTVVEDGEIAGFQPGHESLLVRKYQCGDSHQPHRHADRRFDGRRLRPQRKRDRR